MIRLSLAVAMAENGETDAMDQVEVKEEPSTDEMIEDVDKDGKKEATDDETEAVEHTEDYQKLIDYGINAKVATELDKIYKSGQAHITLLWNNLVKSSLTDHFPI